MIIFIQTYTLPISQHHLFRREIMDVSTIPGALWARSAWNSLDCLPSLNTQSSGLSELTRDIVSASSVWLTGWDNLESKATFSALSRIDLKVKIIIFYINIVRCRFDFEHWKYIIIKIRKSILFFSERTLYCFALLVSQWF